MEECQNNQIIIVTNPGKFISNKNRYDWSHYKSCKYGAQKGDKAKKVK